jgi:hypothetical protein
MAQMIQERKDVEWYAKFKQNLLLSFHFSNVKYSFGCLAHIAFSIRSVMQKLCLIGDDLINMGNIIP